MSALSYWCVCGRVRISWWVNKFTCPICDRRLFIDMGAPANPGEDAKAHDRGAMGPIADFVVDQEEADET